MRMVGGCAWSAAVPEAVDALDRAEELAAGGCPTASVAEQIAGVTSRLEALKKSVAKGR